MKFIFHTLFSRMRRQKTRSRFALLAIAASSCLIVWVVGGFNALFIDETIREEAWLGSYDMKVSAPSTLGGRRGGGTFASPLSRERYAAPESDAGEAAKPDGKPESKPEARPDGSPSPRGEGRGQGGRGGGRPDGRIGGRGGRGGRGGGAGIARELVDAIRADDSVAICDEVMELRLFAYAPGTAKSILEDDDADDEGAKKTTKRSLEVDDAELGAAREGVDPELRRQAFGAYRATMGTPMGAGSPFYATTATEARFELEDGRWLAPAEENARAPREAVMTRKGAESYAVGVGDSIFLIGKSSLIGATTEYQLAVVGVVDDPETEGFYITASLGREIAEELEAPLATSALMLKFRAGSDSGAEAFRARWNERFAESTPALTSATSAEIAEAKEAAFKAETSFKYQASSGALLAALASLFIVFTALNTSVDENRRLIAFYRAAGMTRGQVAVSVLLEGVALAIPGWCAGMAVGWVLVFLGTGKWTGLNSQTVAVSFLCSALGAVVAALYPMARSMRVKPLDAINSRAETRAYPAVRRRARLALILSTLVGLALIGFDVWLVNSGAFDLERRAALHSVVGALALALGVAATTPLAITLAETILAPVLAKLFRFDVQGMRRELSGNYGRVVAVAIALSVGGGLFTTMQIWGYSMLDPFLPGRRAPEAFAAFLPTGLRPELVDELKTRPFVDPERFLPVAVEQAAFAEGSVPEDARKSQFANVVFFGVDVAKAFEGATPLVGVRFRQGDPATAFAAMKTGRGVIVTDSLTVDYQLNLGDELKTVHPRDPEKILSYPIVGVVSFPGWQWLSKTGGVRRNFGRSGGVVFAREGIVATDYQIERRSYFWFDAPKDVALDYQRTELALDKLALKNLALDRRDAGAEARSEDETAYVKLSTRESLTNSISRRADSVIWGLSKTPLVTLAICSIAVVGAIANSVRARRWRYGVMRALGLTRGALVRMILVEGLLIGAVAATTSFLFGYLAASGALKLGRSMFGTVDPPLILPTKGLCLGLALTLALCMIAAVWPAIKTGRAEPTALLQSGRSPD